MCENSTRLISYNISQLEVNKTMSSFRMELYLVMLADRYNFIHVHFLPLPRQQKPLALLRCQCWVFCLFVKCLVPSIYSKQTQHSFWNLNFWYICFLFLTNKNRNYTSKLCCQQQLKNLSNFLDCNLNCQLLCHSSIFIRNLCKCLQLRILIGNRGNNQYGLHTDPITTDALTPVNTGSPLCLLQLTLKSEDLYPVSWFQLILWFSWKRNCETINVWFWNTVWDSIVTKLPEFPELVIVPCPITQGIITIPII